MFKVNRYISIFLLVCFLPVVTPREFIHDLLGHEDTLDIYHSTATLEKLHKHCSILQVTFSSFVSYLKNFLFQKEFYNSFYSFPHQSFIPGVSVNLSSLRAPPSHHI
ncbi:MAG: hypothetical protein D4R97_06510 [Bacteroidetes bacterium]|nr:MAG: hypothetical protein D4R97_06510 [Bacteroidota bacterium]